MRHNLLTILLPAILLLLPAGMYGNDYKTIEKSDKKIPEWVGQHNPGYLEITTEGKSLGEARQMAERELLRRIIMSVATNVSSHSLQTSAERLDGDKVSSLETFDATTEIAAANLPFIKGVSLSEAAGSYWELLEDKKSKRRFYRLEILYPLSDRELAEMRRQFTELDNGKQSELNRLKEGINTVDSTEGISEAEATLGMLKEYFFDSTRRNEAEGLAKRYAQLYKGLSLQGEVTGDGVARLRILLNGRPFRCSLMPKVTSGCASRISVTPQEEMTGSAVGTCWEIRYSTADCLPLEENTLEVTLNIKGSRLRLTLPI